LTQEGRVRRLQSTVPRALLSPPSARLARPERDRAFEDLQLWFAFHRTAHWNAPFRFSGEGRPVSKAQSLRTRGRIPPFHRRSLDAGGLNAGSRLGAVTASLGLRPASPFHSPPTNRISPPRSYT
jgi:hypothetical protein